MNYDFMMTSLSIHRTVELCWMIMQFYSFTFLSYQFSADAQNNNVCKVNLVKEVWKKVWKMFKYLKKSLLKLFTYHF